MTELNKIGLLFGYELGAGQSPLKLNDKDVFHESPEDDVWHWMHFDMDNPATARWLISDASMAEHTVEALTLINPQPRIHVGTKGILLLLRGINMNPHEDPEDLVTVRAFIERNRIITLQRRRVQSLHEIRQDIDSGDCPESLGGFVTVLVDGLINKIGNVLQKLNDDIDDLDDQSDRNHSDIGELRKQVRDLRLQIIPLKRHLVPQRDVLTQLAVAKAPWLDELSRAQLRESAQRLTRYVEDLAEARERLTVIQEALTNRLAEKMNSTMLVLSIAAAVFLPLSFLAGLLGINVGGIPGAEHPYAFWIVSLMLVLLGGVFAWWLYKHYR